MSINNDILRIQRTSLRAIYRRYAWNARSILALHPGLFAPVMRLKPRERSWIVQDDTQFVIEGFPRSANTFAVMAFARSQTENIRISHHMHAPANVMLAAARNLPILVLIRRPLDAITSWVMKYPYKSIPQAFKYYSRFYRAIAPYQEKYLLATFEEVTSDFGTVMANVNEKFGTHFGVFEHTEENVRACFSQMNSITLPLIAGVDVREAQVHYPSALRDSWKATICGELRSDEYRKLLAMAEDVYAQMLEDRCASEAEKRARKTTGGFVQIENTVPDASLMLRLNPNRKDPPALGNLLSGKNVLLTGAGRNIGRAIAIEMGKAGAHIYFTEIDPQQTDDLEQELASGQISSKGFISDICKEDDVDRLCGGLRDAGVSIDILVNNVGIEVEEVFTKRFSLEAWRRVFDTNVLGPIYLTKRISQAMIDHHVQGSILFITSIHQWVIRRCPSYSASKTALGMIIKEMALELAPHKIRVNGIAPGYVQGDADGNPVRHKCTPLYGSSINPRYIGRAAVYLSADYFSKFTTGTVLKVDSGLSLYNHLVG